MKTKSLSKEKATEEDLMFPARFSFFTNLWILWVMKFYVVEMLTCGIPIRKSCMRLGQKVKDIFHNSFNDFITVLMIFVTLMSERKSHPMEKNFRLQTA